jgi:hypothetical protein
MKGTLNTIETLIAVESILAKALQETRTELAKLEESAKRYGFVAPGEVMSQLDAIQDGLADVLVLLRRIDLLQKGYALQSGLQAMAASVNQLGIDLVLAKVSELNAAKNTE